MYCGKIRLGMSSPVTSIIPAAGVKLGLAVAVLRRIGGSREVPVTEQPGLTSHCVFRDCITPFLLEIRSGEKWRTNWKSRIFRGQVQISILMLNYIDENGAIVRIKKHWKIKLMKNWKNQEPLTKSHHFLGVHAKKNFPHEGKNCYRPELVPHHMRYPKDIHIHRRRSHPPPIQRDFSCWT
jgi:hypothetical protein